LPPYELGRGLRRPATAFDFRVTFRADRARRATGLEVVRDVEGVVTLVAAPLDDGPCNAGRSTQASREPRQAGIDERRHTVGTVDHVRTDLAARCWHPAGACPVLDADCRQPGLYDEGARRGNVGWDDGWERLRAVVPTRREGERLAVRAGVAAFAVDRVGRAQGRGIEVRSTLVRGGRYSVHIEWSPSARYAIDMETDARRP